jgi:hypothetical protein
MKTRGLRLHEADWRCVVDAEGLVVADVRVHGQDGGREVAALLGASEDMARALFAAKRALLGDVDPGRVLPLINDAIMKAGIPFDWVPPSEDEE